MKLWFAAILLLAIAACGTCGKVGQHAGSPPEGIQGKGENVGGGKYKWGHMKDPGLDDLSARGPDDDPRYPEEGVSIEFGGSISADGYMIHRR